MRRGSDSLRVAIIGAGAIARNAHLPAWRVEQMAQCVAIHDVDDMRAREVSEWYGDLPVRQLEEILGDPEVDALDICAPPPHGQRIALSGLTAGKHVLLEKPLLPLADAHPDQLAEAALRMSLVGAVADNWCYHRAVKYARHVIRSGFLGDVLAVNAIHETDFRIPGKARPRWTFDNGKRHGDYLRFIATHSLSVIVDFFGEPLSCLSYLQGPFDDEHPFADQSGCVVMEYPDSMLATLRFSGEARRAAPLFLFSFVGGSATLDVNLWSGTLESSDLELAKDMADIGPSSLRSSFGELIHDFTMACVGSGETLPTDFTSHARVMTTIDSIYLAGTKLFPTDRVG